MLERIHHGDVHEFRLARPPVNALSPELIAALLEAVRAAPGLGARAVVLSGRAGMFSAGLDVPRFLALDRALVRHAWSDFFELMRALAASRVSVAAALTGHAPAGGCVIALFCEWRVMAEGPFKIGLNEVQVGLPVPRPIHAACAHVVAARAAERLCSTASLLSAAEARAIGLVDELAPADEVVPRALAWATAQTRLPPIALERTRELVRHDLVAACDDADVELERVVDDWMSSETQGAMRALVERLAHKC
jgi:enoyl-CoA hydratase/carnithine racemase